MKIRFRLALALATLAAGLSVAHASDPIYGTGVSNRNQAYPTIVVVDPSTGLPVNQAAGGGSGGTGTVNQGAAGATAWKVDGSGVTQPVSGTVVISNTAFGATPRSVSGGTYPITTSSTQGAASVALQASTSPRLNLEFDNDSATATIAVCKATAANGNPITPAINGAGCHTIGPGQSWSPSPLAVPTDAYNVVCTSTSCPVTVEAPGQTP